jgi:sodium-dependent dicarboxylate transporter 2/3/5
VRLSPRQLTGLLLGLGAFAALAVLDTPLRHAPQGARPAYAAAVVALMAIWWVTEALPIHWTACVPLVAFPLLDVFGAGLAGGIRQAALPYVDPYIFLFGGGMAIAAAMQQWNLHRRIALSVMVRVGTAPARLLLGVLAATAFVSMWISNTATAAMMFPIGLALLAQLEAEHGRRLAHYGMAVMLAIAYGANLGGIGTKIGTAPNLQFAGFMERLGTQVSFPAFLAVGLPFVALLLPVAWWTLWRIGRREGLRGELGRNVVVRELERLGAMRRGERWVLAVFLLAAAAWMAGQPLTAALRRIEPGIRSAHVEGGVAMLAAAVLLVARSERQPVLRLRSLATVPWETLLLLGGGFAMAAGVAASGLSDWAAGQLLGLQALPAAAQVAVAALVAVAISAFASNTSTIAILLVVLREAVAPELLPTVLFAATLACSCDFALPAGTPPNAIVFGSGYVRIPAMARAGVPLDLASALVAAVWCWLVVPWVL